MTIFLSNLLKIKLGKFFRTPLKNPIFSSLNMRSMYHIVSAQSTNTTLDKQVTPNHNIIWK